MKFKLISKNKGIEIDQEVDFVEAESLEGHFGVLENHIPFITILKNNSQLKYESNKERISKLIQIEDPVLEVKRTQANGKASAEVIVIASKVTALN